MTERRRGPRTWSRDTPQTPGDRPPPPAPPLSPAAKAHTTPPPEMHYRDCSKGHTVYVTRDSPLEICPYCHPDQKIPVRDQRPRPHLVTADEILDRLATLPLRPDQSVIDRLVGDARKVLEARNTPLRRLFERTDRDS